jgi:hypothetical protein
VTTAALVESVEITEAGVLVCLKLDQVGGEPIAPGWCGWSADGAHVEKLVLHRLVARDHNVVTLASLDRPSSIPKVGATVEYTSWWAPNQYALVTNTEKVWTRRPITPGMTDELDYCEFCGLCWARISELSSAYQSAGDWICEDCFATYIDADFLGVRTP